MPPSAQIVLNSTYYVWLFKYSYNELHLGFSGVEKQQAAAFHWEEWAALGQETQADFPGGKPY